MNDDCASVLIVAMCSSCYVQLAEIANRLAGMQPEIMAQLVPLERKLGLVVTLFRVSQWHQLCKIGKCVLIWSYSYCVRRVYGQHTWLMNNKIKINEGIDTFSSFTLQSNTSRTQYSLNTVWDSTYERLKSAIDTMTAREGS